jgi:uncharacterized protein
MGRAIVKIVIPGGTGQVGTLLARHFSQRGDEVVVLSRSCKTDADWKTVVWDGQSMGEWAQDIDGADVVINLAGRNVNCRYNEHNRTTIKQSRIDSTRVIGQAIQRASIPPHTWLQASTATIYEHTYGKPHDEKSSSIGGNEDTPDTWQFSIDVATSWEEEAHRFNLSKTRLVLLRSAMTMSPDRGGIFDTLLRLIRFGLGGQSGNGRQFVSWIHDADFIRAIDSLIESNELSGAVNISSPNPLPNKEFMRVLRSAWGIRAGLPATRWMLEIGAIFLKTETELILKSRRVIPGRLLDNGFKFQYSTWSEAAADLCRRWRKEQER